MESRKSRSNEFISLLLIGNLLLAGVAILLIALYDDGQGTIHPRRGGEITPMDRLFGRVAGCTFLTILFVTTLGRFPSKLKWLKTGLVIFLLLTIFVVFADGHSFPASIGLCFVVAIAAVILIGLWQKIPRASLSLVSWATIICGILLASNTSFEHYQRLIEARNAFPITDLAPRLEYEGPVDHPGNEIGSATREFLAQVQLQLETLNLPADRRTQLLERFHDEQYETFIRAEGFGVSRMRYPRSRHAELPPLQDLTFDETADDLTEDNPSGRRTWQIPDYGEEHVTPEIEDSFLAAHISGLVDFLDPRGFGYIPDFGESAGFVPHAFHRPPSGVDDHPTLKLQRLELVSLLRFPSPKVYVLEHLPRMDQLSSDDIETRDLSLFETFALDELQDGENLVTKSSDESLQMFGAIRAQLSCLQCHSTSEGQLLGAFSYQFVEIGEEGRFSQNSQRKSVSSNN